MCGFPLTHIDKHLKVLVQQNKRFVAMCEEFRRLSEQGSKVFDRRVVRVITPGTLIDESFLNPYENNYLLSLSIPEPPKPAGLLGLAWIDISTGEFFSKTTAFDNLRDELVRLAPSEVVLDKKLEGMTSHPVFQTLREEESFVSFGDTTGILSPPATKHFSAPRQGEDDPDSGYAQGSPGTQETMAVGLLTAYLHANLLEQMPFLTSPNRESGECRMQIDSHTIKALEIREEIRGGSSKGTLLSAIKRTTTSGGTRLLTRWLCKTISFWTLDPSSYTSFGQALQALPSLKSMRDNHWLHCFVTGLISELTL
jgi:DNA mismatch repair ATPase MutS